MMRFLRRILPFCLAVALLAYALKDISFDDLGRQFQRAHYGWIALVGLITVLTYLVRGKRWQQPLMALGHHPTVFRATVAMLAGVIASLVVPGSGELTRCATLQRTDGVPFSQGIGSVVAERVIDLLMLGTVLLLTLLVELNRMQTYLAGLALNVPNVSGWEVAGGIVAVGLLGWLSWRWLLKLALQQHSLALRFTNTVKGLWTGFSAIRRLPQPYLFVLLTVLTYFFFWLSTHWLLLSLDRTHALPPSAALTILAVSSLGGLAVPTQGGIGTYHFFVSRVLVLYGFSPAEGALVATFLHAVGFGINLILSSLSLVLVPFILTKKPN
ncbi:lysylphosphatidylglycerol synthase transmembrane domain-containing protein [Larkinella insperata]|uniref:Lysylphosphatidylglycerol synthase transmembrane domain-containing protein n=1 Tax=Larkinella insperata TaxID=332158 RepID=A0ABW3QCM1_9BACT|nr:lysylphosphatidylglycerol synthase transmembrane domain-containing protein [Larkinella insperata]